MLFHSDNTAADPFSSTAFSKSYPQMNINLSNINAEQASHSSNATMMTSNQNLSVIEERSNENENSSHTKLESLINPFDEHFITNCVERILNTVRKSQFYLRFTGPLPKLQGTTELDLGNLLKFSLQTTLSLRGTLWYFHDKILSRASISFISMLSSHCVKYRNFT